MAKKKKTQTSTSTKVGIGVGVTTAMLAAAGGYFLYGSKNAAKNRKRVKGWMLKAKGEVLNELEQARNLTKEDYEALVDQVAKSYGKLRDASGREVAEFRKEMKNHWKDLQKEGTSASKAVTKTAKKSAKSAAKKVKKRATKKVAKKASRKRAKK